MQRGRAQEGAWIALSSQRCWTPRISCTSVARALHQLQRREPARALGHQRPGTSAWASGSGMQDSPESEVIVVCLDLAHKTWSAASPSNYVSKRWLVAHSHQAKPLDCSPRERAWRMSSVICYLAKASEPHPGNLVCNFCLRGTQLSSFMGQKMHDIS